MSAKKRVVLCTYSSIYSSQVLKQLLLDNDIEVVAIINSTRVLKPSLNPILGSLYQLKHSGLSYSFYLFAVTDLFRLFQALVIFSKQPLGSIHSLAKKNNIPVFDTRDINDSNIVESIKEHKPAYLLCAHFNQLLKTELLSVDHLECVNIHPSLLPAYRGVDPVFYAMQDDLEEIGVTLHRMNACFDSGETLLQKSIKRNQGKSLFMNNVLLFEAGANLFLKWIKQEKKSVNKNSHDNIEIEPKKQQQSTLKTDHYDSWPLTMDIKKFKKSGKKLMNIKELWKLL